MTEQSINVFITSKNRTSTERPSNWIVNFPSNLIACKSSQGLRVNVVSFHIQNNFYNVNPLNDSFEIIVKDGDTVITTVPLQIENGNYSVITFRDYINNLVKDYFNMSYYSSRNKYKFKRTFVDNTKDIYLKPINSGGFFGLDNDVEYIITDIITEATYTCSMISFDKVVVNAIGLNTEVSSIENIGRDDPDFERSSILLWVSRGDACPNSIIKYDNFDGGNSYAYNLYDKTVNSFNIILTDEYNNELTNALDYTMMLQFIVYEKEKRDVYSEISKMTEYLKNIYIYMMILLEYIGVLNKK
jgi:hypothetical protein